MEKLQYDSFYKFLVSLGAILIALPFFSLYYFISIVNDISIKSNDYTMLTNSSREILNKSSNIVNQFLNWFSFFFFIIIALGLFFLIIGAYKWLQLQKEFDKQIKLKTTEQERIVEKMTPQEVLMKAQDDMNDINNKKTSTSSKNTTQYERLFKAIKLENCYFHIIEKRLNPKYSVQQNVRIAHVEYDIIAKAKNHNVDEIYEVKYWTKVPPLSYINHTIESVEKRGIYYENTMKRNFNNHLIIITSKTNVSKMNEFIIKYKTQIKMSNELEIKIYSTDEIEK